VRAILASHGVGGGLADLHPIDAGELWVAIASLVNYYQDWLRERFGGATLPPAVKVAARITGAWRAVPFIDADQWAVHVRQFGMPVIGSDSIHFPEEIGQGVTHTWERRSLHHLLGAMMSVAMGLPLEVNVYALSNALVRQIGQSPPGRFSGPA
jgi:hypothetical protein